MKVAFITGINYLNYSLKGDILFVLAQLVQENETYREFYRRDSIINNNIYNNNIYIIIDNGASELGKSLDIDKLIESAKYIKADEIICPDVMFNSDDTVRLTQNFLDSLSRDELRSFKFMAVPQGNTKDEWTKCYADLFCYLDYRIDTLGLSKRCISKCFGGNVVTARIKCIEEFKDRTILPQIHLLGADTNILAELNYMKYNKSVRSIDSNIAFKLATYSYTLNTVNPPPIAPTEHLDFNVSGLTKEQLAALDFNIETILAHSKAVRENVRT